jgi:hypothetical protein
VLATLLPVQFAMGKSKVSISATSNGLMSLPGRGLLAALRNALSRDEFL